ncbi:MAG: VanZ family protein [Candidatus Moraniibacteriota bacterium]
MQDWLKLFPLWSRGASLLLWMGVIFFFSSLPGSPYPFEPTWSYFLERKSAHVMEYAVLTILAVRFVYAAFPRETFLNILLAATLFSVAYGSSDELHQFFVPYRGAKISDVLIDSLGALSLACVYYALYRKKSRLSRP